VPYSGLLLHSQDTIDCLVVLTGKSMRLLIVFDRVICMMNPSANNPSILIEKSRLNSITDAVSSTQSECSYDLSKKKSYTSYQWVNHRSAVLTHHRELVVDSCQYY